MSGQVRLTPSGDLDAYTASAFEEQVRAAIRQPGATEVLIDLADVGFVDSSGLGTLIRGRAESDAHGVALRLSRPGSQLLRLMSITSTYALFSWG